MAANKKRENRTRQKILDAAEKAFSRKGFYGTTVRDIFEASNIGSGLMAYYFNSKDELFVEVLQRRLDAITSMYLEEADKLVKRKKGQPSPEDVCFLFINFFFSHAFSEESIYSDYVVLLSHAASAYGEDRVRDHMLKFRPIIDRTIELLKGALPFVSHVTLERSYFYLETAVVTILSGSALRAIRLGDNIDMRKVARDMAKFYSRATTLHQTA